MKFCKDCDWFRDTCIPGQPAKCASPRYEHSIEPVYGVVTLKPCKELRDVNIESLVRGTRCGYYGDWFTPKDSK